MTHVDRPYRYRMPARYRMSGLTVASDIVLPITPAHSAAVEDPADVILRQGEVPGHLADAACLGPNWWADPQRFLLDMPGIGCFLAEDGHVLTIAPAAGVAVDDMLVFATGTAMAAILYQRGTLVLQAAAVVHNGRAFVFCGQSGAGKSSLAAALCRSGCMLLADDMCAIKPELQGGSSVQPDGQALRLYADSIDHLGLRDGVGLRVRRGIDKFHVSPPSVASQPAAGQPVSEAVPLAAIYVLTDSNPAYPPGITPLSPVTAAQALLRYAYRRRLALASFTPGQMVAQTSALLSHAKLYSLHRPRDFARLDMTISALHAHWDRMP